jgi:hypothetical protein
MQLFEALEMFKVLFNSGKFFSSFSSSKEVSPLTTFSISLSNSWNSFSLLELLSSSFEVFYSDNIILFNF